jgi:predicted nucleic acid-binding Zn ribbon protein
MAQYSMAEALQKMLTDSHWKYRYQVTKLKQDWEELMGKTVAKHTDQLVIKDGVLYIYTNVAPLKHELSYNKTLLKDKINQHFGETFIKDIKVV